MTCTVAAVIAFLGYMPPPGDGDHHPKTEAERYTATQQWAARRCARRYGIELRTAIGGRS